MFFSISLLAQDTTKTTCKCCTVENSQFDFWLGDWEAYDKAGKKLLGKNKLVKLQDNCIMQENWTSAAGKYTGTSYNFYNSSTKKWEQLWLDNQGGYLKLEGEFKNGNMILSSAPTKDAKGKFYINRITWSPLKDGRVRQHWELTYDEGKTWKTAFDGYYQKVNNEKK
jgi:hypothetical protein